MSPLIVALKGSEDQPFETGTTSVWPERIIGFLPFVFFAFNVPNKFRSDAYKDFERADYAIKMKQYNPDGTEKDINKYNASLVEQLNNLNVDYFESAKFSLLDPLGIYLANDVKWIKLNQNLIVQMLKMIKLK